MVNNDTHTISEVAADETLLRSCDTCRKGCPHVSKNGCVWWEPKNGGRWRDVFEQLTYTSGPDENVYVYG